MNRRTLRVEIVAPVHNRREITLRFLRSISRLERGGIETHTIIVDDGSTDGTSEAIHRDFPEAQVLTGDGNLWFTEGTNVGVRAALERDPDYVLTTNDDQILDSNCLQRLVETAQRHPRSVVGALLLLWDTPHKVFQVAPQWCTSMGGWRHWHQQTFWTVPGKAWEVELIVGNCVLVPAEAIREAGLMNSKRYPHFGDAEYTPRLRKQGWRLLVEPRARVFCQPNVVPVRLRRRSAREILAALFVDRWHPYSLRRRFFTCIDSAPTQLEGLAAFCIFFLRLLLRRNVEGEWATRQVERPLFEVYADAVVEE